MDFLVGITASIVTKAAEYTVNPVCRQLGYLFYYKSNIDNLKTQIQQLGYAQDRLQHRVEEARRKGEEIEADVENWLCKASRIKEESENFLQNEDHAKTRCGSSGSFPNLVSRHQLSRKAKKTVQVVVGEILIAGKFVTVSFSPCVETSIVNTGYQVFESRVLTFREIMESIKDVNVRIIGIYGMGGIGKTVLAKEVAKTAQREKLFDKVAFIAVSHNPDVERIQQEIAEQMGLEKFNEIKSTLVRADRLRHGLNQQKNILVILDDVWNKLKLSDVWMDFADDQKGCKILLTSRFRNVLQDSMGVERIFKVEGLSYTEGIDLFKKNVGRSGENVEFQPLVKDIVKKCAGLPISITTVACALKNKSLPTWEDALRQLKRSILTNIEGMDDEVYASIKLSYDFLGSDEEAKSLLLLSSLHEEDANIEIKDLMIYGVGWGLFQHVYTLEEARNRVRSLVDKLKDRSLLLEGYNSDTVKMHDVIRDVLISIASQDKRMHNVADLDKFDEDFSTKKRYFDSTVISLLVPRHHNKLPERLDCPQLEQLFVFNRSQNYLQIPEKFFEDKEELKVLRMNRVNAGLLPASFCLLQNLQTLRLSGCMGSVTVIGELKGLKILDLSRSDVVELPKHIGQLINLQLLNLDFCYYLEVIQPGVISSLVRLEELNMRGVPLKWEDEGVDGERINASLIELKNLLRLTTLRLSIENSNILPKALFSEKLERFELSIGKKSYNPNVVESEFQNSLHLRLFEHNLLGEYGLETIIKRSEVLYLYGFRGANNVVYELNGEGFCQVKSFGFQDNDEIRYLVNSTVNQPCGAFKNLERLHLLKLKNLERIYNGRLTAGSFGKLRFVTVEQCDSLKNLFSSSIAKQFEEIKVISCEMLKEIVTHGAEDDTHNSIDKMEFAQLRSLTLEDLPEFVEFFHSEMDMADTSSSDSSVPLFSKKVTFPRLEVLELFDMKFKDLCSDQLPTTFHLQNLTELRVYRCNNLKHLLSVAIARSLVYLQQLDIDGCEMMEEVLITEEKADEGLEKISFPKLRYLWLWSLPKLEKFCTGDSIEFPTLDSLSVQNCPRLKQLIFSPTYGEITSMAQQIFLTGKNLTELQVHNCNNLKHLLSFAIARSLVHLQHLEIVKCEMMEEVLITEEQGQEWLEKISFPKLRYLRLQSLPKLEKFCVGDSIEFPSLDSLTVHNCPRLKQLIFSPTSGEITSMAEQIFLTEKVTCPELNYLLIDVREVINKRWHPQSSSVLPFCTLKRLQLNNYDDEKSVVFPFEFIQRFENLEELSFKDSSVVEIVTLQLPDGLFLRVRDVRLQFLHKLRHLFENPENVKQGRAFQNTEALDVFDCESLKRLVPFLETFRNLKDLRISGCHEMKNLLASSTAKSLVQLTRISVVNCKQMRDIIAIKEGEIEDEIVFSRLRILALHDLPRLESFYPGNTAIRFPLLEKLILSQCPEMESFSRGIIITQKLNQIITEMVNENLFNFWGVKLHLDSVEYECIPRKQLWEGDVNSTVQKIWKDDPIIAPQYMFNEV